MQDEINDTAKDKDIRILWIQILDLLDRLMNVDKRDQLVCSVLIRSATIAHYCISTA